MGKWFRKLVEGIFISCFFCLIYMFDYRKLVNCSLICKELVNLSVSGVGILFHVSKVFPMSSCSGGSIFISVFLHAVGISFRLVGCWLAFMTSFVVFFGFLREFACKCFMV